MRQDKSYNEHTAGVFQVVGDALTRYLCFIVLTYVNKKKLRYAVLPLAGDLPTGSRPDGGAHRWWRLAYKGWGEHLRRRKISNSFHPISLFL